MRIKNICVIGMGYVGLTLAVVLADRGFTVTGVEAKREVAEQLSAGNPHFHEKGLAFLMQKHLGKTLHIATAMPKEPQDAFIISVGTPLDKTTKKPVMGFITNATEQVCSVLTDGALVILRSTVPVGTTRNVVKPLLGKTGKRYHLAFCPERTAEGNALKELRELPQIIGGLDEASVDRALDLFIKITPTTIEVPSLEAAEMVKLLNNAYRDLNFAFANEVALLCERLGLDAVEVIRASNLGYDRSNIPVPGFVGGACLEKDPHILADCADQVGGHTPLVRDARTVNEQLPNHVAAQVAHILKDLGKNLREAKVFVSGFAFKGHPETDDLRGSLTLDLVAALRKHGIAHLTAHDFVVAPETLRQAGFEPATLAEGFREADCAIIANAHRGYSALNIGELLSAMRKPALFYDAWHLFEPSTIQTIKGMRYAAIGYHSQ